MTRLAPKLAQRTILLAAVAAVPLLGFGSRADAQARITQDGHALDANPRIGSGGRNPHDSDLRQPPMVNPNDVIYGNVSGGKGFRGRLDTTDPRAFRGVTADRNVDNFIKSSAGVDSRLADQTMPYYGSSRGVAPPPGYQSIGPGQGGFVPAPEPTRAAGDARLGDVFLTNPVIGLPSPGQLLMPGPVDPSRGQMYITASPLTGIQQLDREGSITHTQYNPVTNQLDDKSIDSMRQEMNREAGLPKDPNEMLEKPPVQGAGAGTDNKEPVNPALTGVGDPNAVKGIDAPKPLAQPLDSAKPINTQIATGPGEVAGQSMRQHLITKPLTAEQANSTYADLIKRHQDAAASAKMTDEEAQRAFNAAKGQADKPAVTDATAIAQGTTPNAPGQPGAAQPGAAAPGGPGIPPAPGAASKTPEIASPTGAIPDYTKRGEELLKHGVPKKKPDPVKVPSLASGVKGKGLAEVLRTAEDLMKQGKFTSALDRYDQAEQVSPNDPLIKLGRANAELGAAYFARAEAHLRDVLSKNPALLGGQYDLTAMLGEQRITMLIRDLKEIANKEQREARPVFLLAYLYYNMGDAQRADGYIDLADKRSGGNDPFFKLLRDNWVLPEKAAPATEPAAPANK